MSVSFSSHSSVLLLNTLCYAFFLKNITFVVRRYTVANILKRFVYALVIIVIRLETENKKVYRQYVIVCSDVIYTTTHSHSIYTASTIVQYLLPRVSIFHNFGSLFFFLSFGCCVTFEKHLRVLMFVASKSE